MLAGPTCDADYVWIQIQDGELIGWTVEATVDEYWIQPITGELYEDEFVSLMINEELANDVDLIIEDEMQAMGGVFPIRVVGEIELEEEVPRFRSAQLVVAPVADFDGSMGDRADDAIEDLTVLLETESDFVVPILETVDPEQPRIDVTFPEDPFQIAARRLIVVAPHYVDMTNGRGIAFVTMYGQDIFPVNNDAVFYNFVGVTNDNQYLVTFRYPVQTDSLIGQENLTETVPNWQETYTEYIRQATDSLNTLSPDDWQPSLDALDEIVESIYVIGGFE